MAQAKTATRVRKAPAPKIEAPVKVVKAAKDTRAKAVKPAPAPKAVKPSIQMHNFASAWEQPSDVTNERVSRTKIDATRFGTLPNAAMTDRDRKALDALRGQFGGKAFSRSNIDAGILRRLGERGFVAHVSGSEVDANATFKLTNRKAA